MGGMGNVIRPSTAASARARSGQAKKGKRQWRKSFERIEAT
jgi:hypothetical protein